jgi:hypothetical protein
LPPCRVARLPDDDALEQEATVLKNRHDDNVLFGDQLWAEE